MGKKRKRAFRSEAELAARDVRVDEHLRVAYELVDRGFAERGEVRPVDSVEYVLARYGPRPESS